MLIYNNLTINRPYYEIIKPMMEKIYYQLLNDVNDKNYSSPIFKHHLNHYILGDCYRDTETHAITALPDDIVADYIASMTNDYFIDLHKYLFPNDALSSRVHYVSYFDQLYVLVMYTFNKYFFE